MIKRFASHFIFLPGHGYLKQYVVGVEEGQVVSAFPLTEEIEGVESVSYTHLRAHET